MKRIAIFASGEGTNAEAITQYFANSEDIEVSLIICNRKEAGVYDCAKRHNIPTYYFPKAEWQDNNGANVIALLNEKSIDLIVLAGFLVILPNELIEAYDARIINIHPSLLPKFGGKGMWGQHVHEAVIDAGEKESGITIHYVRNEIDCGKIILQAKCTVETSDTPLSLAQKVHALEHRHYPLVIKKLLTTNS